MRRKVLWLILLAVMVGAIMLSANSDGKAEGMPGIASENDTATATITITMRTVGPPGEGIDD